MKVIGVHGFSYAPGSRLHDTGALFACWAKMLETDIQGFSYYSYPLGIDCEALGAYWRALKAGYWNKYVAAFKEAAPEAARALALKLSADNNPYKFIIAHSLGARVVNLALKQLKPGCVKRILLLEGAELQSNVIDTLPRGVEVLNICSYGDRVLDDLGERFAGQSGDCIGRAGLGRNMPRWYDLSLDDPETQRRVKVARGWTLNGTPEHPSLNLVEDIRDFGGHWRAYCDMDNAPLYRAWFAGDPLKDILK